MRNHRSIRESGGGQRPSATYASSASAAWSAFNPASGKLRRGRLAAFAEAGSDAEPIQQICVARGLRVLRGQQHVADEDRIRAGQKAKRLQLVGHVLPAG